MRDRGLYEEILGLPETWGVTDVELRRGWRGHRRGGRQGALRTLREPT
jgi:hypothetical protein